MIDLLNFIISDVSSERNKIRGYLTETDTQKKIRGSVVKDSENPLNHGKGSHEKASNDHFGTILNTSNQKGQKSEKDTYDYYNYQLSTDNPSASVGHGQDYHDYQNAQGKSLDEAYEQLDNEDEEIKTSKKDHKENDYKKKGMHIELQETSSKELIFKDTKDEYHEKVHEGVCTYSCKGWPYNNCKVMIVVKCVQFETNHLQFRQSMNLVGETKWAQCQLLVAIHTH